MSDEFVITDFTRNGCLIRFAWSDKEMCVLEFNEEENLTYSESLTHVDARTLWKKLIRDGWKKIQSEPTKEVFWTML